MPRILPRTLPSACVAWPPDGAVEMNTLYHFQHFQPHYDAVIVGARCAGAATAMLLARAGMKVLVIDRQAYGSDTMSTHALMRTGVLQLERWGLLPAVMAAGTPEIRATTFHYGCDSLRLSIKPEHGIEHLCAPRRTVLDRILVDAARSAGADVRHGVVLSRLQIDNKGRVIGALLRDADGHSTPVRSDIVIGADGRQSTVAALVNAETYLQWPKCIRLRLRLLRRPGAVRLSLALRRERCGRRHPHEPWAALRVCRGVGRQPSGTHFTEMSRAPSSRSSRQTRRISAAMSVALAWSAACVASPASPGISGSLTAPVGRSSAMPVTLKTR